MNIGNIFNRVLSTWLKEKKPAEDRNATDPNKGCGLRDCPVGTLTLAPCKIQTGNMAYRPFKTYLGLEEFWKTDMEQTLQTLSTACLRLSLNDSDDGCLEYNHYSLEEFRRNGIEQDLDEVDIYQFNMRANQSTAPRTGTLTEPSIPPSGQAPPSQGSSHRSNKIKKFCVFCKNNGERFQVYSTHVLKDPTGRVTCPILRKYTCRICGSDGDDAHTLRYCPRNKDHLSTGDIFNTRRKSDGQLKRPRSERAAK